MILVSRIAVNGGNWLWLDLYRLRNNTRTTKNPWNSTNVDNPSIYSSAMAQPRTPLRSVTSPPLTTWCTKERRKSRLLSTHTLSRVTRANPSARCRSTTNRMTFPRCSAKLEASVDRAFRSRTTTSPASLITTLSNLDSDSERRIRFTTYINFV